MARRRGSALLLDHCARLELLTAGGGRSARERLETALGREFVRMLLGALCGDHRLPLGLRP